MILTKNATYLHIPKTGGTWVRHVLNPIAIEEHDHMIPQIKPNVSISFVRNPWSWHIASYNAILYGSEDDPINDSDPLILALGHKPSFEEFLETQINPSSEFKRKLHAIFKIQKSGFATVTEKWLDSNKGWYQLMCDMFLEKSTNVGKIENIKIDLQTFMDTVGDLNSETLVRLNCDPKNQGLVQRKYHDMYSYELAREVNISCFQIIKDFDYTF